MGLESVSWAFGFASWKNHFIFSNEATVAPTCRILIRAKENTNVCKVTGREQAQSECFPFRSVTAVLPCRLLQFLLLCNKPSRT